MRLSGTQMKRFTLDKLPSRVLKDLDVEDAFMASRAVIAAERFGVFRLLHNAPLPPARAAARLGLSAGAAERLFVALRALGLLRKRGSRWSNTRLAATYFIEGRSEYWTRQFSREGVETFQEFATLEESLRSERGRSALKRPKKSNYVQLMEKDPARARDFTVMLYYHHQEDAARLAGVLKLGSRRALLDVGGGSGVMSIALAKKNPNLRCRVMDIEPVCKVARQIIKTEGLTTRISAMGGDMNQPLPKGFDVILFSDLGPMTPELLDAAYHALPPGGLLVIADNLLSDDRRRPLEIPLYRLISPRSGWETRVEIVAALREHGFRRVSHRTVHECLAVITAVKPQ